MLTPVKKNSQQWLPALFNDFFGNEWMRSTSCNVPAVNIRECPTCYKVELAAPGLKKENLKVNINDENQLVVSVHNPREEDLKDDQGKYLRREFSYTQFQQTMLLPDNVEKDKIEAKAEDGVLTITIPKKATTQTNQPKQIVVQ